VKDDGHGCPFQPEQGGEDAKSIFPEEPQANKGDQEVDDKKTPVKGE
jgi:hypothetical protein